MCTALLHSGMVSSQFQWEIQERASGKTNRKPSERKVVMIYSQQGVPQLVAMRVNWTGGQQGAWGEQSALYCMPHENIMNRSQRPNSQHRHPRVRTHSGVCAGTIKLTDNIRMNTHVYKHCRLD